MACSSCHRASLGSPSPGATDVASQVVSPVQMFTPAQYAATFPTPAPWYTTPLGILGILGALGGLFYLHKRRA